MSRSSLGPDAFLRACALDVAVRKPGNVSRVSPGHRMQAALFVTSARVAVGPLFRPGGRVGERIEAAMAATWDAVGCNTNLGILLLCAPVARALESLTAPCAAADLHAAIEAVLADLNQADARAAYRAIGLANPGGLGSAPAEDVRTAAPSVDLRAAMALAADRDQIAREYRDGYAGLFGFGLPSLQPVASLNRDAPDQLQDPVATKAVQRLYLAWLGRCPDSHIVRKHGDAVAQNVMAAAQRFGRQAAAGASLDADPAFAAWDEELKSTAINPGTSADLTVATLLLAGLTPPATAAI